MAGVMLLMQAPGKLKVRPLHIARCWTIGVLTTSTGGDGRGQAARESGSRRVGTAHALQRRTDGLNQWRQDTPMGNNPSEGADPAIGSTGNRGQEVLWLRVNHE